MVLLKNISIENFLEQKVLYSKMIRGNLSFTADIHLLDSGKKLIINITRDIERYDDFISKAKERNLIREQITNINSGKGVLRLCLNDKKFMINGGNNSTIIIREENFNPKDIEIVDFPKGKVSINIEINFDGEIDNSKIKKELKDYFMEAQNEKTNG